MTREEAVTRPHTGGGLSHVNSPAEDMRKWIDRNAVQGRLRMWMSYASLLVHLLPSGAFRCELPSGLHRPSTDGSRTRHCPSLRQHGLSGLFARINRAHLHTHATTFFIPDRRNRGQEKSPAVSAGLGAPKHNHRLGKPRKGDYSRTRLAISYERVSLDRGDGSVWRAGLLQVKRDVTDQRTLPDLPIFTQVFFTWFPIPPQTSSCYPIYQILRQPMLRMFPSADTIDRRMHKGESNG
jgi:hypothetical protein